MAEKWTPPTDGRTPRQQARYLELCEMPTNQWPKDLQEYVTSATAPYPRGVGQTGEAIYGAIAEYVRQTVRY